MVSAALQGNHSVCLGALNFRHFHEKRRNGRRKFRKGIITFTVFFLRRCEDNEPALYPQLRNKEPESQRGFLPVAELASGWTSSIENYSLGVFSFSLCNKLYGKACFLPWQGLLIFLTINYLTEKNNSQPFCI